MSLADLCKVTQTLTWLLENACPKTAGWPSGGGLTLSVSPMPPDVVLAGGAAQLGMYLYHVAEDAHSKNEAGDGLGGGSQREKSLGLNLYYQLTAQVGDTIDGCLLAQTLMGCAMRVLHDYAIITDDEVVDTSPVLEQFGLHGRQNRFRIALRPVPSDDAVDYWTAGEAPLRMAAYYQVSVVMIEPEPAVTASSPVLEYSSGIFATGAPTLTGSRSTASIVVGGEAAPRIVTLRPTQVTLRESFPAIAPGFEHGDAAFELEGSALNGEGTALRLRGDHGAFDVDAAEWGLVASADRVFATVAQWMGSAPTMPGTWSASVQVRNTVRVGSSVRTVVNSSNETPILIAPRLDPVAAAGPMLGDVSKAAAFTLSGWRFRGTTDYPIPTDPADPRSVRLRVGAVELDNLVTGTVAAGQFRVVDETTLEVFLPADLPELSLQPVSVSVNGASSTPTWLRAVA
ncbi:MAG: DUF4255 domain-containing protein [bacterium]|nr:DUF4255 domain-containing protein [bacterium]